MNFFVVVLLIPTVLGLAPPVVHIKRSPITVPIAARIGITGSVNLVKRDQARARRFFEAAKLKADKVASGQLHADAVIGIPVTNEAVTYITPVAIGTPPTTFNLLIDTGSSNTWVGAGTAFTKTNTTVTTANRVAVTYGSGSFSGNEVTDTVALGNGLTIKGQSIGVATTSQGFAGVDGILGIGPTDLTLGTLSPATNTLIPTVTDNLFTQGIIPTDEIAVSFQPTNSLEITNGELTFGGTDSSKFTGSITFFPITNTSPSSEFWGINQSVRYGASTSVLSSTAGIVDTGTTLVLLATNAFNTYRRATGGVLDATTGLVRLTTAQFANLQPLNFVIGGTTFVLSPNAQAWPRNLNTAIGGNANSVYLIVNDLGSNTGQGLDFVNGFTFLERFYSVFDTTNKRLGLATTSFTTATTN